MANHASRTSEALPRRALLRGAGALATAGLAGWQPTAAAQAADPAAWDALRTCLRGTLTLPDDAEFGSATALFDPQFDTGTPAAAVAAATPDDVRAAVTFARAQGLAITARAGGHSYVGASATTGALVVDVRGLREITLDGDLVTVGAGATTFPVLSELARSGQALPVGTCPTVGLAGLTLGGGIGVDSRRYGLTCDRLVAADLVLPTGATARASADELPGLFWALRGAGPATGIVTALTYRTCPATPRDILRLSFPGESAGRVLAGWARWLAAAPRTVWANVEVSAADGSLGCAVQIVAVAGEGARAATDLAAAVAVAPASVDHRTLEPLDAALRLGGGETASRSTKVAGSDVSADLSPAVAETIVEIVRTRLRSGATGYVLVDPLDGAIRDIPADATAFPWRDHTASLQWVVEAPDDPEAARRWIRDAHRALGAASSGAYVNYLEPDQPPERYYGANLARLRELHRTVDPDSRLRPGLTL
ncbi:FAD-binding oxidoreductase [Nocardia wallacei]|uniref:FAD-binding oxidoreductase n=1 Tax=Nocardia wallacei TaxID=480035 RepID=UPI0024565464|nr:FAD-binding oxidoreductase [Nocardia wallacei]